MSDSAPARFVQALTALPVGTTSGTFAGQRYVVSKTLHAAGKSVKLVAEETGGQDYISLNLYRLTSGARLYPCEMSRGKVIRFVEGFAPDGAAGVAGIAGD
ncbi:MAG: hypothetical protein AAF999_16015 [Pseudomonadota bacterium]